MREGNSEIEKESGRAIEVIWGVQVSLGHSCMHKWPKENSRMSSVHVRGVCACVRASHTTGAIPCEFTYRAMVVESCLRCRKHAIIAILLHGAVLRWRGIARLLGHV